MGMSAGNNGGGGGEDSGYSPMAEINITPMVDVMLVLLVIFMVTAPLLTQGIEVGDEVFHLLAGEVEEAGEDHEQVGAFQGFHAGMGAGDRCAGTRADRGSDRSGFAAA